MVTTIPAKSVNLRFLIEEFGLQRVQDSSQFFPEWQEELPEITVLEKQLLDNELYQVLRILKRLSQIVIDNVNSN